LLFNRALVVDPECLLLRVQLLTGLRRYGRGLTDLVANPRSVYVLLREKKNIPRRWEYLRMVVSHFHHWSLPDVDAANDFRIEISVLCLFSLPKTKLSYAATKSRAWSLVEYIEGV
jgi:hypothetical protein